MKFKKEFQVSKGLKKSFKRIRIKIEKQNEFYISLKCAIEKKNQFSKMTKRNKKNKDQNSYKKLKIML